MSLRRDKLVSLSTVVLALAGGIALGGGPLHDGSDAGSVEAGDSGAGDASSAGATATEQSLAFDEAYLRATAPSVLGDRLEGRTVAVVALPGATRRQVTELTELVGVAGGVVTVHARVAPGLLDVGNRQLVAELARQTQEAAREPVAAPPGSEGYELTGRLLGHALLDEENAGAAADRTGEGILAGFSTAGLVQVREPVTRRGSLALVVAGEPRGSDDERDGAATIAASLLAGLDASSDGAVLAGPTAAAAPDGVVGAVRSAATRKNVSTVDAVDTFAGAVVAVRALAAEADGRTGHYGGAEAPDGVLPPS